MGGVSRVAMGWDGAIGESYGVWDHPHVLILALPAAVLRCLEAAASCALARGFCLSAPGA